MEALPDPALGFYPGFYGVVAHQRAVSKTHRKQWKEETPESGMG